MQALRPTDGLFRLVLPGVVAVSVLLGGCAALPRGDGQTVNVAEVVQGYDCLAPNLGGWETPTDPPSTPGPPHPDAPDAGRVPANFIPTRAVRCDQMASISDAEGQWSAVTAITLIGDLTPLLAALAEPDDGFGPGPCTADMELVSPLWLVDSDGQAIRVHYPRDSCAKTKPGVHKALAGLSVQDTATLKRTLVVPRAALDSRCAPAWTAPWDEGTRLAIPSTGSLSGTTPNVPLEPVGPTASTVMPTEIDGMIWCRYAVEPSPTGASEPDRAVLPGSITLRSGRFIAGGTLDTATARSVAEVAASARAPHSCPDSSTMFLTLSPTLGGVELGTVFTVELEDCNLLSLAGSGARTLPPGLIEQLTAQTKE